MLFLTVLALCAGAVLFTVGFFGVLPRGVFVDGVDVGGLSRTAAVRAVRAQREEELKRRELRICAGETVYRYRFPEFTYTDNLNEIVGGIRRSGQYSSGCFIYLNGADEIAAAICADVGVPVTEPYARFNAAGQPFDYVEGNDGLSADGRKLLEDISRSLNGDFSAVTVRLTPVPRTRTLEDVKRGTVLLRSFTTYFDGGNLARSSNIALAAAYINGNVIGAGQILSFNQTVGPRTRERGFQTAKIIFDGKFIDGVGGGVCQVSTTLYNAALLGGLTVEEYHPHSLAVGYVPPSRDAMVSGNHFDLKIKNCTSAPVYVRMNVGYGSVGCTLYGTDDGTTYSLVSSVTGSLPQPEERVVEGDEDKMLTVGREGTLSECYLVAERDGQRTARLLRRDRYAAVGGVRQVRRTEDGQSAAGVQLFIPRKKQRLNHCLLPKYMIQ